MSESEFQKKWESVLKNFIGYGDPNKAEFFFFGLEEKDNFEVQDTIEEKRLEYYQNVKSRSNKFYWIDTKDFYNLNKDLPGLLERDSKRNDTLYSIAKLYKELTGEDINQIDIGSSDYKLFNGNIYPFPKEKHDEQEPLTLKRKEIVISFLKDKVLNRNKTIILFGAVNEMKDIIAPLLIGFEMIPNSYKYKSGNLKPLEYYFYKKGINKICILPHICSYLYDEIFNNVVKFLK